MQDAHRHANSGVWFISTEIKLLFSFLQNKLHTIMKQKSKNERFFIYISVQIILNENHHTLLAKLSTVCAVQIISLFYCSESLLIYEVEHKQNITLTAHVQQTKMKKGHFWHSTAITFAQWKQLVYQSPIMIYDYDFWKYVKFAGNCVNIWYCDHNYILKYSFIQNENNSCF